jgi:hypothetical protein
MASTVLESGERIAAKWVFGADSRGSTVAGRLGLRKERTLGGEISFLFGYWRGIPDDGYATLDIRRDLEPLGGRGRHAPTRRSRQR